MCEKDLLLDKRYLLDNFGYNIEEELIDSTKAQVVCIKVYNKMLTYIMSKNANYRGKKRELIDYLLSNEDLVEDFKLAEYTQLYNMIWLDTDEVLQDVYDIISCNMKLVDLNGWQTR